jgi:hypothetical protein
MYPGEGYARACKQADAHEFSNSCIHVLCSPEAQSHQPLQLGHSPTSRSSGFTGGPYPLLAISGEQGSAKTVLCKLLKALVDPNAAPVRALSREQRELMIAANNSYLLAFDNLPGLPHLALRCSLPACHWRQLRPCGSSLPTLRLTFGPRSARSS